LPSPEVDDVPPSDIAPATTLNSFSPDYLSRFTRGQAALFHLAISALVAGTIFAGMLLVWYPSPYFEAAGGKKLLTLIVGVDIILGPLLTFVVFNPTKRSLVYDLAAIVMVQIAALIYGVQVMASARPAFVVYIHGAFAVVAANEVVADEMADARLPEFQSMPLAGPRLAAARIPVDPGLEMRISMESISGGPDFSAHPRFYIPYATAAREAAAGGKPLAELAQRKTEKAQAVANLVSASGMPVEGLVYLPLRTRLSEMTIVLEKANGNVVGVIPVEPL
jgi:hypothetical protein